jgi:hypothetical protein
MIQSAEEFVRLRTSTRPEEYHQAAHGEASTSVWTEVIERYPQMRSWVAHNKTVPTEILAVLASDPDPGVRAVVAEKRRLPVELFRQLAGDPNEMVRARVAYNRKVPSELLEILAADPADLVREAAEMSLTRRRGS